MKSPRTPNTTSVDQSEQALPPIDFVAQGSYSINNPDSSPPQETWHAANFSLGKHHQLISADGVEDIRSHSLALVQQAQRSLCIYSSDLEGWLYNHSSMQQACSSFLLANPKNTLRILVQDTSTMTREGHLLLALHRRLSSRCSIRKVNLNYDYSDQHWLIADDCGLLTRTAQEPYQGTVHYYNPNPARVLQNQRLFNAMWDVSLSDVNLRSMLL